MITLTNVGANYDTIDAARGLGIQRIDFRGATTITFDVFVNKIGTGTQSWQLWNETDGTEIGVINDSGAAGRKFLSAVFNVDIAAIKLCRVRAKSTVATDDPLFFGASVLLNTP